MLTPPAPLGELDALFMSRLAARAEDVAALADTVAVNNAARQAFGFSTFDVQGRRHSRRKPRRRTSVRQFPALVSPKE